MPYTNKPTYIKKIRTIMKDGTIKEYTYVKNYYKKKGRGIYKDGKTHRQRRLETVKCTCGKEIKRCSMIRHINTSFHILKSVNALLNNSKI